MTTSFNTESFDPSICPICGKSNQCQMAKDSVTSTVSDKMIDPPGKSNEQASEFEPVPCWCTNASFPKNYTQLLEESDINTRCICPACLAEISKKLSE